MYLPVSRSQRCEMEIELFNNSEEIIVTEMAWFIWLLMRWSGGRWSCRCRSFFYTYSELVGCFQLLLWCGRCRLIAVITICHHIGFLVCRTRSIGWIIVVLRHVVAIRAHGDVWLGRTMFTLCCYLQGNLHRAWSHRVCIGTSVSPRAEAMERTRNAIFNFRPHQKRSFLQGQVDWLTMRLPMTLWWSATREEKWTFRICYQ